MAQHYVIELNDGTHATVLSGDDGRVSARQRDGSEAFAPYGLEGVRYVLAHATSRKRDVSRLEATDLCGVRAWLAPSGARGRRTWHEQVREACDRLFGHVDLDKVIISDFGQLNPDAAAVAIVRTIAVCAGLAASEGAWLGAVEGAERDGDDAKATRCREAAQQCRVAYESACAFLARGSYGAAVEALNTAGTLEREFGDDQHARRALEAIGARAHTAAPRTVVTLRRLVSQQIPGESLYKVRGGYVAAGEVPDVEVHMGVLAAGEAWHDLPLPACPDCDGTLAWAEAGSVPGARRCNDCGSMFSVTTEAEPWRSSAPSCVATPRCSRGSVPRRLP